ncbi:hypothetical protein BC831DRAFT_468225 [Entophlyctis helioformis]|nr:hypothetical protein BC831DRAFT_468225 [Entophlyctis helioformis]
MLSRTSSGATTPISSTATQHRCDDLWPRYAVITASQQPPRQSQWRQCRLQHQAVRRWYPAQCSARCRRWARCCLGCRRLASCLLSIHPSVIHRPLPLSRQFSRQGSRQSSRQQQTGSSQGLQWQPTQQSRWTDRSTSTGWTTKTLLPSSPTWTLSLCRTRSERTTRVSSTMSRKSLGRLWAKATGTRILTKTMIRSSMVNRTPRHRQHRLLSNQWRPLEHRPKRSLRRQSSQHSQCRCRCQIARPM